MKRDREKEKNLKKENFFRRDFFPEKILFSERKFSFPRKNSLFMIFLLKIEIFSKFSWRKVNKGENGSNTSVGIFRGV